MSYKENCKAEGEIMTRFKIARLFFAGGEKQRVIARHIGCHYNTVNGVIKLCHGRDDSHIFEYLKTNKQINRELLLELFGFLKNESRSPKGNKRYLDSSNEKIILEKHKKLHGGVKRIFKQLKREGLDENIFTIGKIKGVFKRNKLRGKKIRTANGERRALYNYEEIGAFEYMQYDTKDVLDKHALPVEIYEKFKNTPELPIIQWTIVDAKTKTRFLAWSYARTSFFGFKFLLFTIMWLRSHGIRTKINVQFDGGMEFCSMSKTKTEMWNEELKPYNVHVSDHGGSKWKQNLVERTHRIDDEEFYCPRGERINTKSDFLIEGQKWIIYHNHRSSDGIGMDGLAPFEKLKILGIVNAEDICRFPCLILEDYYSDFMRIFDLEYQKKFFGQTSQYVLTYYLWSDFRRGYNT
jgi:hypothetical protein